MERPALSDTVLPGASIVDGDLSWESPTGDLSLRDINLELRPGKLTAIVGEKMLSCFAFVKSLSELGGSP